MARSRGYHIARQARMGKISCRCNRTMTCYVGSGARISTSCMRIRTGRSVSIFSFSPRPPFCKLHLSHMVFGFFFSFLLLPFVSTLIDLRLAISSPLRTLVSLFSLPFYHHFFFFPGNRTPQPSSSVRCLFSVFSHPPYVPSI